MKVLFLDVVHPYLWETLSQHGFKCVDGTSWKESKVKEVLPTAEGIVVRSRFKLTTDFLSNANCLKFIARSGAGMETIDEAYCQSKNIQLFNAPEGNRNAVAEHALGMLLSLFNHISEGNKEVKNGVWDREGNRGVEIEGKTVGIIGFGNNGSQFAKLLSGFGCRILAYDKYKTGFSSGRVEEVSLEEIYQNADILSFHIPQTLETIEFANTEFFLHFRKPIYLINLSRGSIVNLSALTEALNNGKVLGACLDVLPVENMKFETNFQSRTLPKEVNEILHFPNVLLTPHVGGWTQESYFKLSKVLADKILAAKF